MELLRRVRGDFGIPLIGVRPTGLGADALSPEGLVTLTLSEAAAEH